MRTRPRVFELLSICFFLIGLSMPLQMLLIYEHPLEEYEAVFWQMTDLNYAVLFSSLLSALLAWRASSWLQVSIPMSIGLVLWNNWQVGIAESEYSMASALSASFAFLGVQGLWLLPEARRVIGNPDLRWWRTPSRKRVRLPAYVETWVGDSFSGKTFDISKAGLFLAFENVTDELRKRCDQLINERRRVTVKLLVGPLHVLRLQAEIVRHTEGKGAYPEGLGLRFVNVDNYARHGIQCAMAMGHVQIESPH